MNSLKTIANQTIYDAAIQAYGSLDDLGQILSAVLTDIDINDSLPVGTVLDLYPTQDVLGNKFRVNEVKIASGWVDKTYEFDNLSWNQQLPDAVNGAYSAVRSVVFTRNDDGTNFPMDFKVEFSLDTVSGPDQPYVTIDGTDYYNTDFVVWRLDTPEDTIEKTIYIVSPPSNTEQFTVNISLFNYNLERNPWMAITPVPTLITEFVPDIEQYSDEYSTEYA